MPAAGRVMLAVMPLLLSAALGFRPCPSSCLCYESSDLVDCRSRGLPRVPPGVPHGAWLLDLRGNKVTELPAGSFVGLWSLKILMMANNSMHTLQPQVQQSGMHLFALDSRENTEK